MEYLVLNSKTEILFFTARFPYGVGEAWKRADVMTLASEFRKITILPLEGDPDAVTDLSWLPENVFVETPLFESLRVRLTRIGVARSVLLSPFAVLAECRLAYKRGGRSAVIDVLVAAQKVRRLLAHSKIKSAIARSGERVIYYFYWGVGSADIIPFVNAEIGRKSIVRFHRFDLYADSDCWNGHIPFQETLVRKIGIAATCSEHGKQYLQERHGINDSAGTIQCLRLGTIQHGQSPIIDDGILRLVSVAFIQPVKRVWLLAEALHKVNCNVVWQHIGDGPDLDRVRRIVEDLPSNVKVELLGRRTPNETHLHIARNAFDLLVNTSESEGVPVSIMEALSAGIPVLATNVGGTSEIVDDNVGKIVPSNITASELAGEIDRFANMSLELKRELRDRCLRRYTEKCDQGLINRELLGVFSKHNQEIENT